MESIPDTSAPCAAEIVVASASVLAACAEGWMLVGWPPVVIVGGSGAIGLLLWLRTYRHGPVSPAVILPPFLLTVAMLEVHMAEEYLAGFAPAMSRLFDIGWTERGFLLVFAFAGPAIYALTALGLFRGVRLAGFVAAFIFVGPGAAEFTHFLFPLLTPAIDPDLSATITRQVADGTLVADMGNHWIGVTGRYYFPGLYTAVMPMVPGIWGVVSTLRAKRRASSG
ncbi:hypothetical protein SAMN05192583_1641 [Sphingomonas gellani]|uniref:Uncharacterized protein n=1 Tax=Sphingomonas gellani TaxID=1166340 RepID=A0A1H8CK27_9SPHN|nr:hypothetical protein [Sphingomonas gellani]SEM95259.1 hypothetical protein SAMN05192583_1641 [Sphingomonas gellani]